jgi:hypothetical protein
MTSKPDLSLEKSLGQKLEQFLRELTTEERKLLAAAMAKTVDALPKKGENRVDYAACGAQILGGVAGWLKGGGALAETPMRDIVESSSACQ